jgi:hypothetical protein
VTDVHTNRNGVGKTPGGLVSSDNKDLAVEEGEEPVLPEACRCYRRVSKLEAGVVLQETISSEADDICGGGDSKREALSIAEEDVLPIYETADCYSGAEISVSVNLNALEKAVKASSPGEQVSMSVSVESIPVDADYDAIGASADERNADVRTRLAHNALR